MERTNQPSKQACRLIAGIVVGGVCILIGPVVGHAEPGHQQPVNAATSGAPDAATSSAPGATGPGRAGQWIHVDPQTGERVAPPTTRAAIAADPAFSTSPQGLVEQPDTGGGVMVDLKGRFRSAATATTGADGNADLDCIPPGTAARESKP